MPQAKKEPAQAAFDPAEAHGHFCWNELMAHDVERAKAFYAATVGWTYQANPLPDGGTYWIIKMPGKEKAVGGIFQMKGPQFERMPEQWVSYLAVDDVDNRLKAAAKAGADVMCEPFDIPTAGRIAVLREPGGALINWMTPKPEVG